MAYTGQVSRRQKLVSGGGALLTVGAVGLGLASGLDLDVVRKAGDAIAAIALPAPPPPREEVVPAKAPSEKASAKASAANKHAKAAAVAAPPAKLPPIAPPITAAPRPGAGNDASAGATPEQAAYSMAQAASIPNARMTTGWPPSITDKEGQRPQAARSAIGPKRKQ